MDSDEARCQGEADMHSDRAWDLSLTCFANPVCFVQVMYVLTYPLVLARRLTIPSGDSFS